MGGGCFGLVWWENDGSYEATVWDLKKGEQLVLFTTDAKLERKTLSDALKAAGATELMIPKTIIAVKELPVLGSGKTDYVSLNRMAREQVKP